MYNPYDFYFNKAKKSWFKARSAFKLEEIQKKFKIFDKTTKTIVDIGCSPGSWLQYAYAQTSKVKGKDPLIVGFDIKDTDVNLPNVYTYIQDVTDVKKINQYLTNHEILPGDVDVLISDMAPNTIGLKDIDAIRLFSLLEQTFWLYEEYLRSSGKFVVKVFMWPGFEEFIAKMKKTFWTKNIKVFKPQASRKNSKETYVVKFK